MRPGVKVDDFTVRRVLSRDREGVVCEAMQAGLDRTVVLRVLSSASGDPAAAVRLSACLARLTALDHPSLPRLLVAGDSVQGPYAAFRMPAGRALTRPGLDGRARRDALRQLGEALESLHGDGLAHGGLDGDALRVDATGKAVLLHAGTVIGDRERAIDDDRAAFARLEREASLLSRSGPARRARWALAAVAALAVAAAAVLLFAGGGERQRPVPAPLPGTIAIGSALGSSNRTVGCDGRAPKPQSPPCTLAQSGRPGSGLAMPRDGVIRAWTVRGASGELAVQVIRRLRSGWRSVHKSQIQSVPDLGVHRFGTDLPVRAGDHVALEVLLGSGVGIADRGTVRPLRWPGTALGWHPMAPDPAALPALAGELLLRAELAPGAHRREPESQTGGEAAGAPSGEVAAEREMPLAEGGTRLVRVVRLGRRLVVDVFRGSSRRVARMAVPDAQPDGSLERLEDRERTEALALEWRNPDGTLIRHAYLVRADSLVFVD